ncbi:hypothetical protein DEO72_LG11g1616 [Vigna unguiculata]|uniref:Uncharacterized protein n=1 Tax=Vigna unguiculata TaxID=3917 RepID=A0A4D6NLD0_VIGUN|nr:hypothetical protein DEO72_LG11g1616 [Vigna unguiculata]
MNANQNPPSTNHHCRGDEREPPLQAIIGAAATNDEKTGLVTVAFCSGGDLDGGSSSEAQWRSRERCCHGGSRRCVADLVPCFRVAVVVRVRSRVSPWLGFRVPIWFCAREEEDGEDAAAREEEVEGFAFLCPN